MPRSDSSARSSDSRKRPRTARRGEPRRGRRSRKPAHPPRLLRAIAWLWPSARGRKRLARLHRRGWRFYRRAPGLIQLTVGLAACAAIALAVNGVYQVLRKPTELFFPVSGTLAKTPAETWRDYAPLFRRYSTRRLSPEFLAALAQVEASGNPVARTYWRWSWKPHFFELYRPASSAVGMYQITDGTFAEARRYCIHDHVVVGGPGADNPCWLTGLYFRVIPSHAVELTAAWLDLNVGSTLAAAGIGSVSRRQAERLAAVIHLCGAGVAEGYARRGFRFRTGERCGDQDPAAYVARVERMRQVFAGLAARG